jgi:hypothetical protein
MYYREDPNDSNNFGYMHWTTDVWSNGGWGIGENIGESSLAYKNAEGGDCPYSIIEYNEWTSGAGEPIVYDSDVPCETSTHTPTSTATQPYYSITVTATGTHTHTLTATATQPYYSITVTATGTHTHTLTETGTFSPTETGTFSPTETGTFSPTATATYPSPTVTHTEADDQDSSGCEDCGGGTMVYEGYLCVNGVPDTTVFVCLQTGVSETLVTDNASEFSFFIAWDCASETHVCIQIISDIDWSDTVEAEYELTGQYDDDGDCTNCGT